MHTATTYFSSLNFNIEHLPYQGWVRQSVGAGEAVGSFSKNMILAVSQNSEHFYIIKGWGRSRWFQVVLLVGCSSGPG